MIMMVSIIVLAFFFGMFVVMGLSAPVSDQSVLNYRIDTIARNLADDYDSLPSLSDAEMDASFADRIVRPTLRKMSAIATKMTPAGATDEVRMQLIKAGNPGRIGVAEFTGLKVVSVFVFFGVGLIAQGFLASDFLTKLAIVVCFCLLGFAVPDAYVSRLISARQDTIRRRLPDTIDLLIVSVEAGLGFDGALAKVVEKVRGPISEEFGRVLDEMRLGKQRSKALKDMAARMDLPEIQTFVTSIVQSEQLGVSIANVLRVQSRTIREARTAAIREQAAKLPVKMLIPLIFFIFPSILVVMMGPAIIEIQETFAHM